MEQVIVGLAKGLSGLTDGDEAYLFLTLPGQDDWLTPHLTGPCHRLPVPAAQSRGRLREAFGRVPGARTLWRTLKKLAGRPPLQLARSDGTIEKAGVDVMHFVRQDAFLTDVCSIYQPHDLQHVHLPGHFSREERRQRDFGYRAFAQQASLVVAMTTWGRDDIIEHLGVDPDQVAVVPWAPALEAYRSPSPMDLERTRERYALPEWFAFFPAQTWPHKNHIGLLEALSLLRTRGVEVPLVCTGARTRHYGRIARTTRALGLEDHVRFLGFVPGDDLYALYRLGRVVVFPSAFEGWGMPLLEAFLAGTPVACSSATMLPDLAAGAAQLFDPADREAMATSIETVWLDDERRAELRERGAARARLFSWDGTARTLRAHYRRLAGRELGPEDRTLLAARPLV